MKYHFTTDELTSLLELALRPAGSKVVSSGFKSERNSLVDLLRELTSNLGLRNPPFEVDLFKRSDIGNAYRGLCMVERIYLLYTSMGCQSLPHLRSTLVTILQWTQLYNKGDGEKVAKYQSVCAFNFSNKVEMPELISLPYGWKRGNLGWNVFGRFARKLFNELLPSIEGTVEHLRLTQCFLYFKKGCPIVSETFVEAALKKHEVALTQTKPIPLDSVVLTPNVEPIDLVRIKRRIKEVCAEVFEDYQVQEKWYDPSHSSAYGTSRAKGGQLRDVDFSLFGGWVFNPVTRRDEPAPGNDAWEYFDLGGEMIKVPTVVAPKLKITKDIFAEPVALTEPLKVRVITKETTWSTYSLGGAQKALWKCLKNHPWFRLTGRPVLPEDIPIVTEFETFWISVDYSAATDNLNKEFSDLIMDEISELTGLPSGLCKESLTGHKIVYKDKIYNQTNGQLMGSKLSFIILCIANAVAISLAINPNEFDEFVEMLINGDDGLFVGSRETYERWAKISSTLGLAPSLGKVYQSKSFCVINSQAFMLGEYGVPVLVDYPNASGLQKYDARTYTKPKGPFDLSASYSLWMKGFVGAVNQNEAEKLWYATFNYLLTDPSIDSIHWYLPQCFGGLGIPLPYDFYELSKRGESVISYRQFSRAVRCMKDGLPKTREGSELEIYNPFHSNVVRREVYFNIEEDDEIIDVRKYTDEAKFFDNLSDYEKIMEALQLKRVYTKFEIESYREKNWAEKIEEERTEVGCSLVTLACLNSTIGMENVGKVITTTPDLRTFSLRDHRGFNAVKAIPIRKWCAASARVIRKKVAVWEPKINIGLLGYNDFLYDVEQTQNQFREAMSYELCFST